MFIVKAGYSSGSGSLGAGCTVLNISKLHGVDSEAAEGGLTHRPLSSAFLGLPYRILNINHKKELLRSIWVGFRF